MKKANALAFFARVIALAACGPEGCSAPLETASTSTATTTETTTSSGSSTSSQACAPGTLLEGGKCRDAGVRSDGCPAGQHADGKGGCAPAGVPEDACAEGFSPDGRGGCEPVLPEMPCPTGTMAVPGEDQCHPVAACPGTKYPAVPAGAHVDHVDGSYGGLNGYTGSEDAPWITIQEAVDAAPDGGYVTVAKGTYAERVDIAGKAVHLLGTCPDEVTIDAGVKLVLAIHPGADGTAVDGLSLTGLLGAMVQGATSVTLSHLRVFGTTAGAIGALDSDDQPAEILVADSLVEDCSTAGVSAVGSKMTVERTAVRGIYQDGLDANAFAAGTGVTADRRSTMTIVRSLAEDIEKHAVFVTASDVVVDGSVLRGSTSAANEGLGVVATALSAGYRSTVTVQGSVLEGFVGFGVLLLGSTGVIESSVIRGTRLNAFGVPVQGGILADPFVENDPFVGSDLTVLDSVIDDNEDFGVYVLGSTASVTNTLISRTSPAAGEEGIGLGILPSAEGLAASANVEGSTLSENHGAGVFSLGADLTLEGVLIEGTRATHGFDGYGVSIEDEAGVTATGILDGCVVRDNRGVGVFVGGASATLKATVVEKTGSTEVGASFGDGVVVVRDTDTGASASCDLQGDQIQFNRHAGVLAADATLTMGGTRVHDTQPEESSDAFGDGVALIRQFVDTGGTVEESQIEHNGRAGIALFGAHLSLRATSLLCNGFDLDKEIFNGVDAAIENQGDNLCGCDSQVDSSCLALSSQLGPPKLPKPVPPKP